MFSSFAGTTTHPGVREAPKCQNAKQHDPPTWGDPAFLRRLLDCPLEEQLAPCANTTEQLVEATRTLNAFSRHAYQDWNRYIGRNIFPLIYAGDSTGIGGRFTLFRSPNISETVSPVPRSYEVLKSICHIGLGAGSIVLPYLKTGTIITAPARKLRELCDKLHEARDLLIKACDDPEIALIADMCQQLLDITIHHVGKWLKENHISVGDLRDYGIAFTPVFMRAAKAATDLQMRSVIVLLQRWKQELGPIEWRKLHAVVPTVWPVSTDNPRELCLRHVMDPETVDTNLIVAEGVKSVDDGLVTLARTKDSILAHLLFGTDSAETRSLVCAYSTPRDLLTDSSIKSLSELEAEGKIPPRVSCPFKSASAPVMSTTKSKVHSSHFPPRIVKGSLLSKL